MTLIPRFSAILVLTFFLLTSLANIQAQTRPGSLRGTVTEKASGKPVPQANIVIKDSNGDVVTDVRTDFDGKYQINPIMPGMYTVKCSFTGFATITILDLRIDPNMPTIRDFELQPSSEMLSEVVVVDEAPLIAPNKTSTVPSDLALHAPSVEYSMRGSRAGGVTYSSSGVKVQQSPNLAENTEQYEYLKENDFLDAQSHPLSTFSSDVDVASYANMRRFLTNGSLPPPNAVRIEEMINYFQYDYPEPEADKTFAISTDLVPCSWNEKHQLMRVGINTRSIARDNLPPANLVFLIDVSGSMGAPNKLGLLKKSLKMLVDNLREEDKVAIVVYASATGLVLEPTGNKEKIMTAINQLRAGGSTAGGAGIELAYQTARQHFRKKANNRVILATDGDFNVGVSSDDALQKLIESKRDQGIFLSVLGFGAGNYKDAKMETLADHGNGNYAYIDNLFEAKKVLIDEMGSTLNVVARDAKFQIEFNPQLVQAYRLIGYENRLLEDQDFNDDSVDAGDIGAGHSVTALYEIVPKGSAGNTSVKSVDSLKYQQVETIKGRYADEIATIKIRHKKPGSAKSTLEQQVLKNEVQQASPDLKFICAVAQFGQLLSESQYLGKANYQNTLALARAGSQKDRMGYRHEFLRLVQMAQEIDVNVVRK